jgi:hypothetical protein
MEIESEKEYEYCEEIADSPRYKEHLKNGWEPAPNRPPHQVNCVPLRRLNSRSTKVRFPNKELE